MTAPLPRVGHRFLDARGNVSPEWYRWLEDLTLASVSTETPSETPVGESSVSWTVITNIPNNVGQVLNLSTAGFIRRSEAGAWSASPIVNADLADADTDGLAEGATNLYYTNARVDARIALAPKTLPLVTGEIDGGQPVLVYADDGSLIYSEI